MIRGVIYKWTNLINGKVYVGKTVSEKKRISAHLRDRRFKSAFHDALDKYGADNFKYEVLFITKSNSNSNIDTVLNALEKFYIKKFRANDKKYGYNLTKGGDGVSGRFGELNPMYGKHLSEEWKKKMQKARKEKKLTEEQRKRLSKSLKKVKHTEDWNRKVGIAHRKPIAAYKDGEFVGNWECYDECKNALGLPTIKGISKVVKGHNKTYKGYTFVRI